MAKQERKTTKYLGVFFIIGVKFDNKNEPENIYYIRYKKDGKLIEEKVGRQYKDGMTPAKANAIRSLRLSGKERSNEERREAKAQDTQRITIDRLYTYYSELKGGNASYRDDKSRYINYLEKSFGALLPSEIHTQDIDKLSTKLNREGKSPKTICNILEFLRRLIMFGAKKGYCPLPEISTLHFEMPRVDNQKIERLTPEQIKAVLKALDEEPDQDSASLVRLALITGMRKGALLGLKWADLNFENNFITLRGEEAKKGKTEVIPMSTQARAVLENITKNNSEYVFAGRNGNKRSDFRRIARRVRDKAGLPKDFRPLHGLRHNFASWLASSGEVDLFTLQKLLTHSSPQMTQRYAHLADEALHKAAKVADTMFEDKKNTNS